MSLFGDLKSIPAPALLTFRDPSKNVHQWSEASGGVGLIEVHPFRDEVDQGLGLDGSCHRTDQIIRVQV